MHLMTNEEVARILRVSPKSLRDHRAAWNVPVWGMLGRELRYSSDEIDRFLSGPENDDDAG